MKWKRGLPCKTSLSLTTSKSNIKLNSFFIFLMIHMEILMDVMVNFQNSVLWRKVKIFVDIEMNVVCVGSGWV